MTNLRNCLDTLSIYVSTYAKYNNSSLYGKWFNLSDYESYDELLEAMHELHEDEQDPEFMYQDYENCELFEKLGLIHESFLSPEIYDIAEQINESGYESEVFEAYLDCVGQMDFENLYGSVANYYIGQYSDDKTFAQNLLESDIPDNFPNYIYIDWETTARNIMYDYFESNGYYFHS